MIWFVFTLFLFWFVGDDKYQLCRIQRVSSDLILIQCLSSFQQSLQVKNYEPCERSKAISHLAENMSVSRDKSLTVAKPSRTETENELGQKKKRGRKEEGEEKFRDNAKKGNWAKVYFFK